MAATGKGAQDSHSDASARLDYGDTSCSQSTMDQTLSTVNYETISLAEQKLLLEIRNPVPCAEFPARSSGRTQGIRPMPPMCSAWAGFAGSGKSLSGRHLLFGTSPGETHSSPSK